MVDGDGHGVVAVGVVPLKYRVAYRDAMGDFVFAELYDAAVGPSSPHRGPSRIDEWGGDFDGLVPDDWNPVSAVIAARGGGPNLEPAPTLTAAERERFNTAAWKWSVAAARDRRKSAERRAREREARRVAAMNRDREVWPGWVERLDAQAAESDARRALAAPPHPLVAALNGGPGSFVLVSNTTGEVVMEVEIAGNSERESSNLQDGVVYRPPLR